MVWRGPTGMPLALLLAAVPVAGCVGKIGGDDTLPIDAPDVGISVAGMRRLTRYEYDNTVRDLLGDDTRPGFALLPEDQLTPFDNDFHTQNVSSGLVVSLEVLASDVARRFAADPTRRDRVVGCEPSGATDSSCMTHFVKQLG